MTLLHSMQSLEIFGHNIAARNSLGTLTGCVIILGKNSNGFLRTVQGKYKGYEKLALF